MEFIATRAKIRKLVEEKTLAEEKLKQIKFLPRKKSEKLFGKEGKCFLEEKIERINLILKQLDYVGHLDYIG